MTRHEQHGNHDNHDRQDELRQELLEYYFDCHPDGEALARRLEEDAELAALYEEVKSTAAILETAATAEAPPLHLSPPTDSARPVPRLQNMPMRSNAHVGPWMMASVC